MRPRGQRFDLKSFRDRNNLSQKEISEAVNLPQSFLSAIENGKKSAPHTFLDDLVRIYNVDNISDYIIERKDPQSPKIQNVKEAMVNSEGLNINLNGIKSDVAAALINLLGKYLPQEGDNSTILTDQVSEKNPSSFEMLVELLKKSEERNAAAQQKIQALEKEVFELKSKLPKRKVSTTCN